MTIVVCEPQCFDFEHAEFNAALLSAMTLAFPDARVLFVAEPSHLEWVRSALAAKVETLPAQLAFEPMALARPDLAHWGWFATAAYRRDRAWARGLKDVLARERADAVVLASVSNTGLFAWKSAHGFRRGTPTVAILHAVLATLARTPRFERGVLAQRPRWWKDVRGIAVRLRLGPALAFALTRGLSLRRILMLPPADGMRYVALGPPIQEALRALSPALAARFEVTDLPAFVRDSSGDLSAPDLVRFGFFGVGYKGFAGFARLASAVRPRHANARFDLVGYLNTPEDPASYEGFVDGVTASVLPRAEFERRARAITYAVWTADPGRYRFSASASFVDALCFGKPGIYLRNPFVEHYFARLGDVGYLCDSVEEAQAVIESILAEFPVERYRAQQRAIREGRHIFTPAAIAPRLREIVAAAGR